MLSAFRPVVYFCINLLFVAKTEVSLIMGRNESAGDIDQDDDRFLVALPEFSLLELSGVAQAVLRKTIIKGSPISR